MGKLKDYAIDREARGLAFDEDEQTSVNDGDVDAAAEEPCISVDYSDITDVLGRIFAVVEKYPDGGDSAWFYFLNDWDRRFVLNIYDMWMTTGRAPLSVKQQAKAKVILRKMMTPSMRQDG